MCIDDETVVCSIYQQTFRWNCCNRIRENEMKVSLRHISPSDTSTL
jgi:hypothetical protein